MVNDFKEFDILKRIKNICKQKNWSTYKLAKESGIPYSSLNNMFKRNTQPSFSTLLNNMFKRNTQPSFSTLYKLCMGLNISLADFFSEVDTFVIPLSPDSREVLELYEKLTPSRKRKLRAYLDGLYDSQML